MGSDPGRSVGALRVAFNALLILKESSAGFRSPSSGVVHRSRWHQVVRGRLGCLYVLFDLKRTLIGCDSVQEESVQRRHVDCPAAVPYIWQLA